jgi:preprotein translocase subunit SecF
VYSLLQFEVTPSTVIGVLTILGYSLYDTVVVFDKVKENTRGILGQSRQTYSQAANLAVNQTLVRSINTSIVALLPVAAILFVGAGVLGAGTLKDLSLALFVGMAAGTYSSIFIATPFLAQLMERNPQMKALAGRVQARGAGPRGATATGTATADSSDGGEAGPQSPQAADGSTEAMDRARARRTATGPRNQPKKQSRADRH